ncbi:MAG: flagellar hook-basal body protein [Planctomycetota bacterium]|jgi:flagellar basal body rod protein FlgG|nr:flagellar hook-basal body protein [Planctomycetota bacterium]
MIYGMYLSTMGALVQTHRHATISNNLANANTHGFKPDWSQFTEVPVENEFHQDRFALWDRILMNTGGGVWNDTTVTNLSPGPMQETGNPFDVALHDEPHSGTWSFFRFRPDGAGPDRIYYSRDGHFVPDQDGILRNVAGDMVLDPDGAPVNVTAPPRSVITVREDGVVVANNPDGNAILGQIGVFRTADYKNMVKTGDSRFVSDGAAMENWQNGVMGGYLEESATSAIEEMTNMIEASRVYEANMRFLTIQDEQLGNAVRRIAARTA